MRTFNIIANCLKFLSRMFLVYGVVTLAKGQVTSVMYLGVLKSKNRQESFSYSTCYDTGLWDFWGVLSEILAHLVISNVLLITFHT